MTFHRNYYLSTGFTLDSDVVRTLESGFSSQKELQKTLLKTLNNRFDEGIKKVNEGQTMMADRIYQGSKEAASLIGNEISYLKESLSNDLGYLSDQISSSILESSRYLGAELKEISWELEQLTGVTKQMLEVLKESLSNESRQYYEQGEICFQNKEFDFAKERFLLALEANITNYFAYQYLGLIAVRQDLPNEAIRNFELAVKFSKDYHKAVALSYLGRCYAAQGDIEKAEECLKSAVEVDGNISWIWYELASYRSHLRQSDLGCRSLERAIKLDWNYWTFAIIDNYFDPIRKEVNSLLQTLKEREARKAKNAFELFAMVVESSAGIDLTHPQLKKIVQKECLQYKISEEDFYEYPNALDIYRTGLDSNNIYKYLYVSNDAIIKQFLMTRIFNAYLPNLIDFDKRKEAEIHKNENREIQGITNDYELARKNLVSDRDKRKSKIKLKYSASRDSAGSAPLTAFLTFVISFVVLLAISGPESTFAWVFYVIIYALVSGGLAWLSLFIHVGITGFTVYGKHQELKEIKTVESEIESQIEKLEIQKDEKVNAIKNKYAKTPEETKPDVELIKETLEILNANN